MPDRLARRATRCAALALGVFLATPSDAQNFAAQGYSGVRPPSPVGDAGPNHYVQAINGSVGTTVAIYDKTGVLLVGSFALDQLASGGDCANGFGTPSVLWDPLADRWLLAESGSGNSFCVYVSQTADPAAGWHAYAFEAPQFPNFPVLAVWHDAYVVATDESGPAVYALERSAMLSGEEASMIRFPAPPLDGFSLQALTPADLDGPTPPTDSPAFLLRHVDDEAHDPDAANPLADFLEVFELRADFATPSFSFARTQSIPIGESSSDLCGLIANACIPQPGATPLLDPRRALIMNRLSYRRFPTHESIVGSFVTNLDLSGGTTRAGVRWFELRRSGSDDWALHQEGTHSPDAHHRWVPAIAMNGDGDVAVAYSVSSATVFPGLRWAGRLRGDPLGVLSAESVIADGVGAQTSSSRWGDHFAMSVDPADDCTFWFTGEYMPGSGNWGTRIAAFAIQECPEPEAASLAGLLTLGAIAARAAGATPRCAARVRRAQGRGRARRRAGPPPRGPHS